jgi:hypothetical protein
MARMVFSGFFDRWPNLGGHTHHMGAMIPYFMVASVMAGLAWHSTSDRDYTSLLKSMKKRPIDYFHHFYADTALFGARAGTICGLDFRRRSCPVRFEPCLSRLPGLYTRRRLGSWKA